MTKIKGIDVSHYQGVIDFQKVKNAGVQFVIIKAGYGKYENQKDECFEENYKNAKAAGLDVGAYWFSYAKTANEALQEAKACVSVIKGKKFEYPIYFDLEGESLTAGKTVCSEMCRTFCNYLEKNNYYAGIYISRSPAQNLLDESVRTRYALWLAEYGKTLNYSGPYGMWQYSSTGKINGISGNVDCNYCYYDYPNAIKKAKLNGYSNEKILDSSGYQKGDKTIGVLCLKELITIARKLDLVDYNTDRNEIFGDGTEKCVNQLLEKWGYSQNGRAGKNFILRLGDEISSKI